MIHAYCLLVFIGVRSTQVEIPQEVKQAACESTVRLVCQKKFGSGVAVGMKDTFVYVLTANHVIAGSKQIELIAQVKGEVISFKEGQVVWATPQPDLALIRFAVGDTKIRISGLSPRLKKVAYPLSVLNTGCEASAVATAHVDQALTRKDVRLANLGIAFYWQTMGKSIEGRSGGGLFRSNGDLIGICSANEGENGYFTHIDEILHALRQDPNSSFLVSKDGK